MQRAAARILKATRRTLRPAFGPAGRVQAASGSSRPRTATPATLAATTLALFSVTCILARTEQSSLKERLAALVQATMASRPIPNMTAKPATSTLDGTPQVPMNQQIAGNWSGYALSGGRFTTVTGTFTVPTLSAAAACGESVSEWVGADGYEDDHLIQAGVLETQANPYTGRCAPGSTWVVPWTEVLPSNPTPAAGLAVDASDSVTVSISLRSAASWEITLTDNTTGGTYSTSRAYDGPAQSAEWIVEAPGTGSSGVLAPYAPAVSFYDLSVGPRGPVTAAVCISMEQYGVVRSTPSPVSGLAELMSKGFGVTYGQGDAMHHKTQRLGHEGVRMAKAPREAITPVSASRQPLPAGPMPAPRPSGGPSQLYHVERLQTTHSGRDVTSFSPSRLQYACPRENGAAPCSLT